MKVKSLSRVRLSATPWTVAHQAPPSMGFSRQEYWSGVPLPSPMNSTLICKASNLFMGVKFSFVSCSLKAFVYLIEALGLINHECCIWEFAYSVKFICNPKIKEHTHGREKKVTTCFQMRSNRYLFGLCLSWCPLEPCCSYFYAFCCYFYLLLLFFWPCHITCGLLSPLTRDQTQALSSERVESQPLEFPVGFQWPLSTVLKYCLVRL